MPDRSFFVDKWTWLPALLLLLVTLAVYFPAHSHPFATLDDHLYVTQNKHVQAGLTPDTVVWAFTRRHASNWHPLTWLTLALGYQVFGLNPVPYHVVNILLHAINAVVLFWVLKQATGFHWPQLHGGGIVRFASAQCGTGGLDRRDQDHAQHAVLSAGARRLSLVRA